MVRLLRVKFAFVFLFAWSSDFVDLVFTGSGAWCSMGLGINVLIDLVHEINGPTLASWTARCAEPLAANGWRPVGCLQLTAIR